MALDMVVKNAGKFDLLITDLIMPEMNGKELYEKISSMIPGLRVIICQDIPMTYSLTKGFSIKCQLSAQTVLYGVALEYDSARTEGPEIN